MRNASNRHRRWQLAGVLCLWASSMAPAGEHTQWGRRFDRNMVSDEKSLPESFDPATGRNVRWVVPMGTETYVSPMVARGRVLIGTNNGQARDPRHRGDRGVLMCLDAADGSLVWQLVIPKVQGDPYKDWPGGGITSPPTVEDGRCYLATNRGAIVCLDLAGQANGNDGPFVDEDKLMAPEGAPPLKLSDRDADVIWRFDTHAEAGSYPHDAAFTSILLHGPYLYLNTSNGVDNTHRKIRNPDAPGLIVLDKATGRLLARDREGMSPRTFHCTWSPPALGEVGGRTLIFFGGGDGVLYGFEALKPDAVPPGTVATLKKVWSFDCDPNAPKEDIHRYVRNRRESPSNIMGMSVFHEGRVYVAAGGDMWWGKRQSWLKCVDATKTGDITRTGGVWSAELVSHCSSTPAIRDGLVYIADCGGVVHCLDLATGREHWTHKAAGPIWSSPLVADGKVYIGSRGGDFLIFAAGKEKKLLASIRLDGPISAPPTIADGVLYLTTMKKLYAVQKTDK